MNICFVTDQFTDYVSGVEQSLRNQIESLERAGHTVFLIRPHQTHQPVLAHELTLKPLVTLRIGGAVLPLVRPHRRNIARVHNFLTLHAIDIIHGQGQGPVSYTTLLAARTLKLPFVDTLHSFFLESKPSLATFLLRPVTVPLVSWIAGYRITPLPGTGSITNRTARGTILTFLKTVDLVISPSEHQRDALKAAGLEVPIVCIPNPLSIHAEATPAPLPSDQLRVVWVGRMAPEKRLTAFAEALTLVHAERPGQCSATIVGEGVEKAAAMTITSDIPTVSFVGRKTPEEVLSILDTSQLLILSSYHFDNQPMVITEAISRHRGVIYCDERLAPEVGEAGLLTDGSDARAIADAMIACIDKPELVAEVSRHCQQSIQLFLPEQFVARTLAAYATARDSITS